MATFVLVHNAFGSPAELSPVIPLLEAPGHRVIAVDLPCTDPDEVRETILSVSRDDGNGCRSFDLEMLASIAPPEERDAYLAFLRATQRRQGWAAVEQPWPGRSLPDVPCAYVLCTQDKIIPPATQREMAARHAS